MGKTSRFDDIDAVLSKGRIVRGDGVAFVERVRDEQAIEWITAVMAHRRTCVSTNTFTTARHRRRW